MKINILSVTHGEFEAVETNEPLPSYRRYGPEHWDHYLGDLHGWHRLMDASLYEEVYQEWKRINGKQTKTFNK